MIVNLDPRRALPGCALGGRLQNLIDQTTGLWKSSRDATPPTSPLLAVAETSCFLFRFGLGEGNRLSWGDQGEVGRGRKKERGSENDGRREITPKCQKKAKVCRWTASIKQCKGGGVKKGRTDEFQALPTSEIYTTASKYRLVQKK